MFTTEYTLYFKRAEAFREHVKESMYGDSIDLTCEYAVSREPVAFKDRLSLRYQPIHEGEKWGESWESAWLRFTATVPESFEGKELVLLYDTGGESLIFDASGTPVYALTGGSVFAENFAKSRYVIGRKKAGESLEFWIESAANMLFGLVLDSGNLHPQHPYGYFAGMLKTAKLAVFRREIWNLFLDLDIAIEIVKGLPENDYRRHRFVRILSNAANAYNETPANAEKSREILKGILSLRAADSAMTAHAVGHAHIDSGWLWPVRETIRKCARTFAAQIDLIEKYPDYIFGASAAQHYAFTKEHYPELYKKIKQAVKEGRWEIQGGMWVEADCNLISGESMVRQFLHGKNFFMDEFGFDVKNLWIPDVFGYSAALPQIIRKSACDYFLTQKMSWNQFNKFPYQTFKWKGIDGSEVITHFPPENTYNSLLQPKLLMEAQNTFMERDSLTDFMSLFGIGDGGGGPTEEQIERGRRMADLECCPKVKFDRADRFFEELSKKADLLPTWKGELYLELHRGTLTTQSRTKRNNRKLEQLLTTVEFLASMLPFSDYPAKELDKAWKLLLLNQFHDIIPGSSITKVYQNTEKEHAELIQLCSTLLQRSGAKLFPEDSNAATLLNSLSYDYDTVVELPESWNGCTVLDDAGNELPTQKENGRTTAIVHLPKSSVVTVRKGGKSAEDAAVDSADLVLENDFARYVFSPTAALIEAYDKVNDRHILKPGCKGNDLSLYVDFPVNWEAWDVDIYYSQQFLAHPESVRARKIVDGGVRSALEFELRISGSTIRQIVVLDRTGARLDFRTAVEWHEDRKMLRTAFPIQVFADDASFDIQYGYVKRSMNDNTSWDIAKFEVAAQRYADISEANWGTALLNDCKYGHKVKDGVIDLALLRAPKYPDYDADQGHHEFTYSLLPHSGDLIHSDVMAQGALLNRGVAVFDGCSAGNAAQICTLESESVTLEVVKKAEKENCHVVRMVETLGCPGSAVLHLSDPALKVSSTNLLEWTDEAEFRNENGTVRLEFAPFEIKTIKIRK